MESTPDPALEQASIEASEWLIRLQEDLYDPVVQAEFHAWVSAAPANRAAWAETRAIAQAAFSLGSSPNAEIGWNVEAASASVVPFRRPRRRWAVYAGAVAVAASLAWLAGPDLVLRLQSDLVTDVAESQHLDLPDGSRIILAAASAVAVSFTDEERRVSLLRGEAFFEVRHEIGRPFKVVADDIATTVVGTSFDVRRDSSGVAVAVEEGIVEVSSTADASQQAERLTPGQTVRWSWKGEPTRSDMPIESVGAWRRGQLVLHDQRLSEAVDHIRRYYRGTIVLAESALADKKITGAYNLVDPEEALRAMSSVHGAKVRQVTPWLIVISSI